MKVFQSWQSCLHCCNMFDAMKFVHNNFLLLGMCTFTLASESTVLFPLYSRCFDLRFSLNESTDQTLSQLEDFLGKNNPLSISIESFHLLHGVLLSSFP